MANVLILPLGVFVVGLVAFRLAILTVSSLQTLAREREQTGLRRDLLIEQIREAKRRQKESTLAWNGYRKFEIDRKVDEALGVCSFYLVPHDRKSLPSYRPGQYLTFRLAIPGREKPVIRCYSLSDCPRSDYYRVTVKRVAAPPDSPQAPPGLVSNYFHEQLVEGDILDVQAPRGQFFLETTTERPAVLIAGGVGVTPLLSMAQAIAETGSGREMLFFYGVRNGPEHAFREDLAQLAEHHANIRLVVAYSSPTPEDMAGEGQVYHQGGRIDIELIKSYLQSTNYEFYIVGPPPMMDDITRQLTKWGVAGKDIKTEAFGPATVKKAAKKPVATSTPAKATAACQVTFARSDKKCDWTGEVANLLDLAEANKVQIESGCRAGNCGTCVIAIKEGNVSYVAEHGAELEEGTCLACIATPQGDLVLDA